MTNQYQVIVLGSGPGGYVAAIRASQLGLKTAIIEKKALGGVCLNTGCIPSKALLRNSEVIHIVKERGKEFGFSLENLTYDYSVAFKRSRQASDRQSKGVAFLMKKNKIDVYEGAGQLTGPKSIQVAMNDGSEQELQAENIIIATGARPRLIPGVEADGEKVITYEEGIMRDSLAKRVVIVGAGAIGVEFAYMWANYDVEVHLVEMLPRLLPREDPEVSKILEKAYKKLGIKIYTGVGVDKLDTAGEGVQVTLQGGEVIECEQVLLAINFAPNVENIGLEAAAVELSERGNIKIDEYMRTNVPGIYAIGDVATEYRLAHIASAMGVVAAETIAGHPTRALDFRMMPRATFCVPQVASFGYTEEEAQEAGYEINVGRFNFQPNGKAVGMGEREGFVKIISDKKYGEILGAHMIGPEVTELLPELTLAQMAELTSEEIAYNVHAHPTLSEVVMEAAHEVEGQSVHL